MRKSRSEQARALFQRAGTADLPIAVDTRVKTVRNRKGKDSYRRRDKHQGRGWR